MIADVCFDISLAFLSRRILIKRPVNVCDTIYRPLCYWLFGCAGGFCDWNGFWVVWTDLSAADWRCLMAMVRKCWFIAWSFMDSVMNCLWFWLCSNFLSRFSFACCCCYKPLVSGFAGCLKLIVIKNPCKTGVLWICWNYLWDRCWRLVGKCVIFGFFAADTATKQPKWLFCKCRSTAL